MNSGCPGEAKRPLIYFLDGAHTKLSMESCVSWFSSASASEAARAGLVTGGGSGGNTSSSNIIYKALIFNLTKDDRQARYAGKHKRNIMQDKKEKAKAKRQFELMENLIGVALGQSYEMAIHISLCLNFTRP